MKSIIIDEISEVVVNYEDKINNSYSLEKIISKLIVDSLLEKYPEVMVSIIESNERIKTSVVLQKDKLYDQYKQNIIDKNYLPVPRLEYVVASKDDNYIELSPREFLELNIRGMIYPIIIRNYSLVTKLEFLEYAIARIEDPYFYSNISNLVYLRESLTNPFIDKLFSLGAIITGTNFLKEVSKTYKLATGESMESACPSSNIYISINNLISDIIKVNTVHIKNAFKEYGDKIFEIFLQHFNLKRTINGLEKVNLDEDTKDNYSFLLCNIMDEMDALKLLKTYYSNGYAKDENYCGKNGFYYDNGSFIVIENLKDSLIENIKSKISYRKFYGIQNEYLGSSYHFRDYGYGFNLVEHEPFTTLIHNSCYDFITQEKEKLTLLTLKEYKENKKTLR